MVSFEGTFTYPIKVTVTFIRTGFCAATLVLNIFYLSGFLRFLRAPKG